MSVETVKPVLGEYGIARAQYLSDKTAYHAAQEYRRTRARMRPIVRDDLKAKTAGTCHVSKKMDGEFCVLSFDGEEAFLVNPGGTVRFGLPLLREAAESLKAAGVESALVAGELYAVRNDGKRPRVHDVVHVAANPESVEDLRRLRFAAFDTIRPSHRSYGETWMELERIVPDDGLFHRVEGKWVESAEDVIETYDEWVASGGEEGIVVRAEGSGTFKVKPKHTIDAVIVGFSEATGDRQGMVHDLLVALVRQDGAYHVLGHVGSGISDEERATLLSDLKDEVVESEYAEVNSDHVAYQMVAPTKVVELSCLDVIATTTAGTPIAHMVLHFDRSEGWKVKRAMPLVNVISPVFKRVRHDKRCTVDDVGIDQVERILPVLDAGLSMEEARLPKSEILHREVWVKVMKGKTMVRKLVAWKTNKREASMSYPAFVLHYTDFSPNRKVPLSTDVRISNSCEQIDQLWNEFVKSKITGGWVKHEQGRGTPEGRTVDGVFLQKDVACQ